MNPSLPLALLLALTLPAQARPLSEIIKTRELRACIVPYHPSSATATPADCREKCHFTGPVYDEVAAFARHLGKHIQLKTLRVEWDEQFYDQNGKVDREASYTPKLLANGSCDVFPSRLTKNAWRLKKMDFVTLFPNRMMVVANVALKGRLQSASHLAGLRAAVLDNSSYSTWLLEQNQKRYSAKPVRVALMSVEDSLRAVDAGKADFTLLDSDIAIWTTRHQFKHAYVAFPVGDKDEVGWAMRKEDQDLQAAAAAFFAQQKQSENSELNRIWTPHYGLSLSRLITLVNSTQ
ncbi:transporter substrate-binding domain-containing protein [Chromobacterium alticapitis]|nr:transporter substrate-binding domain-containing protein [Chromobacterium alticapitis]